MARKWALLLCGLIATLIHTETSCANVGGVTFKPGVTGRPLISLTDISVSKEDLYLKFFEKDGIKFVAFTATYYLTGSDSDSLNVSGIFYGYHTSKIQVFFNGKPAFTPTDTLLVFLTDSVLQAYEAVPNYAFSHLGQLNRSAFQFTYVKNSANVLTVTGEVVLKPTELWWLQATPAIYARHPLFNSKVGQMGESFHYLVSPIKTWKKVGSIDVYIERDPLWNMKMETIQRGQGQALSAPSEIVQSHYHFEDQIPDQFSIYINNPHRLFAIGGPVAGFKRKSDNTYSNRFGWEFGLNHRYFINTIIAIDYETDFNAEHQITLSAIPATQWFAYIPSIGFGAGIPVKIVGGKPHAGIRFRSDYTWGFFSISFAIDTFPTLDNTVLNNSYRSFSL